MSKSAKVTIRLNSTVIHRRILRIIGSVQLKNSFCIGRPLDRSTDFLGTDFQRREIHDHEEGRAVPYVHRDHAQLGDPALAEPWDGGEAKRVQHPVEC